MTNEWPYKEFVHFGMGGDFYDPLGLLLKDKPELHDAGLRIKINRLSTRAICYDYPEVIRIALDEDDSYRYRPNSDTRLVLIAELEIMHDKLPVSMWRGMLEDIAIRYGILDFKERMTDIPNRWPESYARKKRPRFWSGDPRRPDWRPGLGIPKPAEPDEI